MKFDSDRKQYYLEKDDVLQNTPLSDPDLKRVYGEGENTEKAIASWLKKVSFLIYDYIDSRTPMYFPEEHTECVRWYIHQNAAIRQRVRDAMIELVMADVSSGMALASYDMSSDGKLMIPQTAMMKLRPLMFRGPLRCEVDW